MKQETGRTVQREESEVKESVPPGFSLQATWDVCLSQPQVFVPFMLFGFW